MRRRKELRPDPDKVRDWQQRSRDRARERARGKPRRGLRQGKRKAKAKISQAVRRRVFRRTRGKCVRPGCDRPAAHIHHWLDEQHFPELAKAEDNMSGTCPTCNWTHHFSPGGRFPRSAIPSQTWRLARTVGDRALVHLERYYPEDGADPAEPGDTGGGLHG